MTLPDWSIEHGIGESRAVLVEESRIVEARIRVDVVVEAGTVLAARLVRAGHHALARADGLDYLLPKGAPGVTEGARLTIEVTREALGGGEPWKRPLARVSDEPPRAAVWPGARVLPFPAADDRLDRLGWSDLIDEARSGMIGFPGGELRVSLTPAMALIDVDGTLPVADLALAGAAAAACAIRRHGIGGSIGIDLPTVAGKDRRAACAAAIDAILPQPFERTAVNGFGFVQIVRPRRHSSLFELAADRAAFEARALLRRCSRLAGSLRIDAHPAVVARIEAQPEWIEQLARQVGGTVHLHGVPGIAMAAGHGQNL